MLPFVHWYIRCHICTLHRDLTLLMPVPNPTTHAVPPLLPQCRPLFAACATAGPGPKCCARLWCQPLVAGRLAGACRQVKSQRGRHGAAGTFTCESAPSGSFCNRHTMQRSCMVACASTVQCRGIGAACSESRECCPRLVCRRPPTAADPRRRACLLVRARCMLDTAIWYGTFGQGACVLQLVGQSVTGQAVA